MPRTNNNTAIEVKVGKLPGVLGNYALPAGSTVSAALAAANLSASGYQIRVNGEDTNASHILSNGDRVVLARTVKGNTETIVRIGKLPGRIFEVALNGDNTVAAALAGAGLSASGFTLRVNGRDATTSTRLYNGDTVYLTTMVKGNMPRHSEITVKVGKLPGVLQDIALNGNRTAADAIAAANLSATGYQIRVNGEDVDGSYQLHDGDRVVLARTVKGNQ